MLGSNISADVLGNGSRHDSIGFNLVIRMNNYNTIEI